MPHGRGDAERGAQEGGAEFGGQFLAGVGRGSEAARLVATEPGRVAGPVDQFVQRRAVVVDLVEEGGLRRDADIVLAGVVVGAFAADADIGPGGGDQGFGARDDLAFGKRRRFGDEPVQPFALVEVEDGEALEEGHDAGVLAGFAGALLLGLGGEAVGVDDGRPALALADAPARREGLTEGQPVLRGVAFGKARAPQEQDVDARIAAAGGGVSRQAGTSRPGAAPRPDPWKGPGFEFRDDLGRHLVIEVGARFGGGRSPPLPFPFPFRAALRLAVLTHGDPPSPPQTPQPLPEAGGGRRRRPAGRALQGGRHPRGRSEAEERPTAAWRAPGRVQKGASATPRFRERPKQSRRANARRPSMGGVAGGEAPCSKG